MIGSQLQNFYRKASALALDQKDPFNGGKFS